MDEREWFRVDFGVVAFTHRLVDDVSCFVLKISGVFMFFVRSREDERLIRTFGA